MCGDWVTYLKAQMLRNPDKTMAAIPHRLRSLLVMAALLGTLNAADFEVQLESAIHREIVAGDLAGAMEQYRSIVGEAGAPRSIMARAYLQIGLCQEKKGQREEA